MMGIKRYPCVLGLLVGAEMGCLFDHSADTESANGPPRGGGWDQNDAVWDEKSAALAPTTSPLWGAPPQGAGTFNALNNIAFDVSLAPSPCAATAEVDIHGSRVNGAEATAPNLWLRGQGRYLAPGETTHFTATMRNDAGWSKPVTIEATRMHDLQVAGLEEHRVPIFDVVVHDDLCLPTALGKVQIGPVPSLAVSPVTHFAPAAQSFGLFQTYWDTQRAAIISKLIDNAVILVAMGNEPDDFYEGCNSHNPIPSREVLFEAAYALSAMIWVEANGNPLLSTGVLMTARGQPVRLHVLYEGEPVCYRQLFPGLPVERLGPPGPEDLSLNPTSIDVVQFSDRALLPGERAVSAAHHGMQGSDTRREAEYLRTSTNSSKYTFKARRDARIANAMIGGRNGRVDSWADLVARVATPPTTISPPRAGLLAAAVTATIAPPGHLEEPMDTTLAADVCGNLVCGPGEAGWCSDCAPPPPPPPPPPGPPPLEIGVGIGGGGGSTPDAGI